MGDTDSLQIAIKHSRNNTKFCYEGKPMMSLIII